MAVVPPCTHLRFVSVIFLIYGWDAREKGIQDALSSQKGMVSSVFLLHRSRGADGP